MRKYIFPLFLLPLTVFAQDLVKEITVDRTIEPEVRAAARPQVFPSLVVPTVGKVNLRMEENTDKAQLPAIVAPFDAAQTEPNFPLTPWRGYVDLGYFLSTDFGISAGYSILNKPTTQLGVWTQFNNNSYKENKESRFSYKTTDLTFGVDFAQQFGKFNTLRISTDLGYSRWNNPYPVIDGHLSPHPYTEGVYDRRENIRWHLGGAFDGRINAAFAYGFNLGGGIFNNLKDNREWVAVADPTAPIYTDYAPMTDQTTVDFGAWLRGNVSEKAILGVKAEGKFLHFSSFLTPAQIFSDYITNARAINQPSKTIGQVDITPAAEFNGGGFYGKIGARFGISSNSGKTFHIAPDILLGVNPDDRFGAWLKIGGGVKTNSLEDMMMISRYADPRVAYNLSNVAVDGQFGLRIGPFRGASLTLTLDYAAANNWLMPTQYSNATHPSGIITGFNTFAPTDLRAWKAGARIDWSYRRMFDLALSYEGALGNGEKHSWIYWADRARHVVGAQATIHPGEFTSVLAPVKPLSIDVAFTARLDRSQSVMVGQQTYYLNSQDYVAHPQGTLTPSSYSLGDIADLSAGASWRFNPQWTIFARFNNLLNRRDLTVFSVPSQGFSGLFGITYKF